MKDWSTRPAVAQAEAASFCYLPGAWSSGGQMREEFEFKNEQNHCRPAKWSRNACAGTPGRMSRRCVAALVLAATLCGAGFVYGQKQKNKQKGAEASASAASVLPDDRAIDLLVSQMLGAWQAGDSEGMHKFYADDITVISGAWEPPIFGWANYARAYEAQRARASSFRLERTNSYTKVMGDTALVTYQWQFSGDVDGKPTQAFGHTTLVLQKRAGNWLIILNHTSAIPTDEPSTDPSSAPAKGEPTSSLAPNRK
jgi:uncharacterized protein (TIGR02246 family)